MIARRSALSLILIGSLSACGGHAGGVGTLPSSPVADTVTVNFSISLPLQIMTRGSMRPLYVSANTQTAKVTIAHKSLVPRTVTVPCQVAAHVCSGTVEAWTGRDVFTVELLDVNGNPLSTGTVVRTIARTTKGVKLTANPVVASVVLSATPGYLGALGPSQSDIFVTAEDASGAAIIGPGLFVSAAKPLCHPSVAVPCLTITLRNLDSSGATSLSATTFGSASDINQTTLTVSGSPPPFDDPYVQAVAPTVSLTQNVDIPLEPKIDYVGNFTGWGNLTSLCGNYATAFTQPGGAVVDTANGFGAYTDSANVGINFLTGSTTDGNLWLFGDNGDPTSGTPNEIGFFHPSNNSFTPTTSIPYEVSMMTAGGDGNLWFAQAAALTLGKIAVTSAGTPLTTQVLPAHAGASIQGLLAGGSGSTVALVSDGTNTWIENVSSGGTISEVAISPSLAGVNIAGHSPADGKLYVVDAKSYTLWTINPQSGAAKKLGIVGIAANGGKASPQAMTALSRDGSLVYVGSPGVGQADEIVHILPYHVPIPFSILAGQSDTSQCTTNVCGIDGLWYVGPDGTMETTDGGNVHALVW